MSITTDGATKDPSGGGGSVDLTPAANLVVGPTDAHYLSLKTNNVERINVASDGTISVQDNLIVDVGTPLNDYDATNKLYVDGLLPTNAPVTRAYITTTGTIPQWTSPFGASQVLMPSWTAASINDLAAYSAGHPTYLEVPATGRYVVEAFCGIKSTTSGWMDLAITKSNTFVGDGSLPTPLIAIGGYKNNTNNTGTSDLFTVREVVDLTAGDKLYVMLIGGSSLDTGQIGPNGETVCITLYPLKGVKGDTGATGAPGAGKVAQVVATSKATTQTCTTHTPVDDTIPQSTEGDEVMTVSITPTNASSVLQIEANVATLVAADNDLGVLSMFKDSGADAIAATWTLQNQGSGSNKAQNRTILYHEESAGSTTARTYKVRLGATASNAYVNADASGNRYFGGVQKSWLKVTEILP